MTKLKKFLGSNTDAVFKGIANISTNARIRGLCGQQSQAHSTHPAPFGARLKNTLRLNRDQIYIRQLDGLPMVPWRRRGYQLQNPLIAVIKALGDKKSSNGTADFLHEHYESASVGKTRKSSWNKSMVAQE